ncbi:MAG: 3-isopropylmalate dehydratase large subunit [SAR202 cluster bacterium]|nr:3-isopropylmalate dehydratase large subunit [Chloroflexota bacterium]MQG08337.1 3-isopropylmalate dehydratase large subunit [SAR202 cluster bacterium]MQG18059.1 3-isopropylmalate dehydratase large subunit [SAR202 cluster bacterium]MQG26642.1 3-isopropylmalate dehydratase large subunit [SAR202 cluster bacterium]MQG35554.1 3-isopropylmalate dehydratase large subunit [SAR202 cluster bacterium]|tara:strand:- start:7711 stop:9123 length:1413 start_codon:yes stop_codon:yes gene_type:complete
MAPLTMFDKLWNKHVVYEEEGQPSILYIDLHLVHEVTSPQAFDGLRMAGRSVRRPDLTVCTVDHNTPTWELTKPVTDEISKKQLDALEKNCKEFGLDLYDRFSEFQGIVHVIGPDLGYTQPGKTVVCGDSHTSTHGALGCFAIGIGTSEVEHVLATQTLRQFKPGSMEVRVEGPLPFGVEAKDVILGIIGEIGTNGGTGYVIEYTGEAIESLSMDGRMTVCNMSIEAGARAGMIAPDEKTIEYVRNRRFAPKGEEFEKAAAEWLALRSDPGAKYDKVVVIDASTLEPAVTWGTNPGMVTSISGKVPNPGSFDDVAQQESATRALEYMGLEPETPMSDIKLDRVFLGACTNSRIDDLRAAAKVVKGKKVHEDVYAMVVPGSALIKKQAEDEGLDKIFIDAGLDWRVAGCSMCLGMNPDTLSPGERCASTSNRNFEGRQGKGGRTHLVSPPMAAAAAIAGHFVDVRDWDYVD